MNKNILFKDALAAVMSYLNTCQSKETAYQFLVNNLVEKFEIHFTEAERLLNLMIQYDYMERKDSFFTILIKPAAKAIEWAAAK